MTDAPQYLSPTILDSRRLFGPNLFSGRAGAVLDVASDTEANRRAMRVWPAHARRLMDAVGWMDTVGVVRPSGHLGSLFVSAPLDGLMTASDLTEHAWVAAEAQIAGVDVADPAFADPTSLLREKYTGERQALPHVVATAGHARAHGLTFSLDDEACSVGSGVGVRTIMHRDAAHDAPADVEAWWEGAHDIPIALVTGSNGKTTTTRLVAAMWRAAGRAAGWCCSDGVWIDGAQVETGDYTGPGAARRVLCDARVEAAVLETARGGMLRRGLALDQVDGAVITNISADHFGEYGIDTLDDLAHAKAIVTRALRPGAAVALNADDASLVRLSAGLEVPVAWFSATDHPLMRATHTHGASVRDGRLLLCQHGTWHDLGAVRDMPITLDGRAQHNIANAAAAALLASLVGVPPDSIRTALSTFGTSPSDNPGRLMVRDVGGVTLVMDYAHNPDGMTSLCRTAASLPARRRLLLLGQAGNRDDAQVRALAAAAWHTQSFERVILKEMPAMLRGRSTGEVPLLLSDALRAAGAPASAISVAQGEYEGVREALEWACRGDLLVLGLHVERRRVLELVGVLVERGWVAGEPLTA